MVIPHPRVHSSVFAVLLALASLAQAQQAPPQPGSSSSLAIIIDDSEAARGQFSRLRDGALAFIEAFGQSDELCLIGAGGKPHLLQDFSYDPSLLATSLKKARPQGQAAVADAMKFAAQRLRTEAANDNVALVVFVGNEERAEAPATTVMMSGGQRLPVNVIAAPDMDWHTQEGLERLTAATGGMAYFPASEKQFREIAVEVGRRMAGGGGGPNCRRPS